MSWFYEGFIAVESMMVVSSLVAMTAHGSEKPLLKEGSRFLFYHTVTLAAASASALYIIIEGDYDLLGVYSCSVCTEYVSNFHTCWWCGCCVVVTSRVVVLDPVRGNARVHWIRAHLVRHACDPRLRPVHILHPAHVHPLQSRRTRQWGRKRTAQTGDRAGGF